MKKIVMIAGMILAGLTSCMPEQDVNPSNPNPDPDVETGVADVWLADDTIIVSAPDSLGKRKVTATFLVGFKTDHTCGVYLIPEIGFAGFFSWFEIETNAPDDAYDIDVAYMTIHDGDFREKDGMLYMAEGGEGTLKVTASLIVPDPSDGPYTFSLSSTKMYWSIDGDEFHYYVPATAPFKTGTVTVN